MDFKQLIGKKIVWSGGFIDSESDIVIDYLLFEDGTVVKMPDEGSDEKAMILTAGTDVLQSHLTVAGPWAENVLNLIGILEYGLKGKSATDIYREALVAAGIKTATKGELQAPTETIPPVVIDEKVKISQVTAPPDQLAIMSL